MPGTHVTTRVMCQMVVFRLLSRARASGMLEGFRAGGVDDVYLNGTLRFLEGNREMNTLRQKEMRRFDAISVLRNCTVAGVMSHACVEREYVATHMEIALREVREMERKGRQEGNKDIMPRQNNDWLYQPPLSGHRA